MLEKAKILGFCQVIACFVYTIHFYQILIDEILMIMKILSKTLTKMQIKTNFCYENDSILSVSVA